MGHKASKDSGALASVPASGQIQRDLLKQAVAPISEGKLLTPGIG